MTPNQRVTWQATSLENSWPRSAARQRGKHDEPDDTPNMLMPDLAILPAGQNQAHCQPVGRLAKVDEHCSGTIRARFLAGEARPLLAAPGSSWRTARHSITSSARTKARAAQ